MLKAGATLSIPRGFSMARKLTSANPDPIDIGLGRRIRELRHLRGLSQTQLGDAVGVACQQVQKYESGTNRVSVSRLLDIAEALGTTVSALVGEEPSGARDAGALPTEVAIDARQLLALFNRIEDPGARRAFATVVELVARANEWFEAGRRPARQALRSSAVLLRVPSLS